jgi:transposase-like protein
MVALAECGGVVKALANRFRVTRPGASRRVSQARANMGLEAGEFPPGIVPVEVPEGAVSKIARFAVPKDEKGKAIPPGMKLKSQATKGKRKPDPAMMVGTSGPPAELKDTIKAKLDLLALPKGDLRRGGAGVLDFVDSICDAEKILMIQHEAIARAWEDGRELTPRLRHEQRELAKITMMLASKKMESLELIKEAKSNLAYLSAMDAEIRRVSPKVADRILERLRTRGDALVSLCFNGGDVDIAVELEAEFAEVEEGE